MATATADKGTKSAVSDLYAFLLAEGEPRLREAVAATSEQAVAVLLARGDAELGRTKHVVSGNPAMGQLTHNGAQQLPPTLIIESGIDWPMPTARITRHAPIKDILAEGMPETMAYQKYQLEVCVSKDRDVWEWLERPADAKGRETRWARRDITRDEAAPLFDTFVRLTDKGLAAASS